MSRPALYDDDILEWSEQQADALRRLARTRHDLSNELDWEHVAEEIEDVGRSELATVQSLTRQILIHLAKAVSVPDAQLREGWRKEAANFHDELLDRFSPSMLGRIDAEKLWQRAMRRAEEDLAAHGQTLAPGLSRRCPLDVRQIVDPEFDFLKLAEDVQNQS